MKIAIASNKITNTQLIEKILKSLTNVEISWQATNGAEAIQKCAEQRPDILLIDLDLPIINGLEAIYHIMQGFPCAILILVDDIHKKAGLIFEAMGYGALDVLALSHVHPEELMKKINNIAILIGKKNYKNKIKEKEALKSDTAKEGFDAKKLPPLLLIGASTGGPKALAQILSFLPSEPAIATIVMQHIDEQFAAKLVEWLDQRISLSVKLVTHGTHPIAGQVLLAGGKENLIMNSKLELVHTFLPENHAYSPSIDAFFSSVATYWPQKSVAVLLTGIGDDGAVGLKNLHDAGWHTIAQHQEGCVVYGMPKAAIEKGGVSEILKLNEIAPAISSRILSFYS